METSYQTPILRISDGLEREVLDTIATEIAFTLLVNDQVLVSLLCSPAELDAMAVGFLLSEGMLSERDALLGVEVDEARAAVKVALKDLPADWNTLFHRKTITSGCGQGVTFSNSATLTSLAVRRPPLRLSSARIHDLLREFSRSSVLYMKTGGVHSAALADGDSILLFAEDIGRHNAVDKLIGKAFLAGIPLEDKLLLSSGRISGEIMTKVIRNRIPVLITRTAPTCMSIAHAEEHGVTMIGFARGRRLNIYTHPLGLILEDVEPAPPEASDG
ncbi:formate dehydrogenase accessory sulfurtransferase FdhD [Desulfurivibrio sp. D14AmB]|uniref:formate dehydrogenase accessory sulfurtransferase FdhD n=1 Tax=Desulfurivibrio sp. D14AmB TaxID=3374370 RepID=UPI00376EB1A9